ncbi:MAG TPA: phosphoenolpyruvate--protein phosphotransferase [Sulfolobales archaeon]|nr:phosphoenolpyruvate--protein phosphotransferase [Sulfolobales archaeon]
MSIFRGLIASGGLTLAPAIRYIRLNPLDLVPRGCSVEDKTLELKALETAKRKYINELEELRSLLPEGEKDIVDAYELIAENLISEAADVIRNENICAALAIKKIFDKYAELLEKSQSQLFALRVADLKDIASALIGIVLNIPSISLADVQGKVIISPDISPSELLRLARSGIKGLVTKEGGITSHAAIIARNNNVPYVIAPSLEIETIETGSIVIVDALEGKVIINPSSAILKEYSDKVRRYEEVRERLKSFSHIRSITLDGVEVRVMCNINSLEEARVASISGCEGIGLFRIEYLYMAEKPPDSELVKNVLTKLASLFNNKPVVVRAPDLGADKPPPFLNIRESNPFLGLRGIRLLLEYRSEIFKPFIKGFLEARRSSPNLKLMLPMISRASEVRETIDYIEEVNSSYGIGADVKNLELGIMVEVPSAALMVDKIVKDGTIRFISFGTNDLTQYVLAVDRTNPRVGNIYDELDPSLLRLLSLSIKGAKRYNVDVEVCGEMASKQIAIPVLLSLGVDALSVNPPVVGPVKFTINKINVTYIRENILPMLLESEDPSDVRNAILKLFSELNIPIIS